MVEQDDDFIPSTFYNFLFSDDNSKAPETPELTQQVSHGKRVIFWPLQLVSTLSIVVAGDLSKEGIQNLEDTKN